MPLKPTYEELEQRVQELEKADKLGQVGPALWKTKEKYRLIFNTAPIGIVHFDSNGVVTECNTQFTKMVGAPYERVIGFNMLKNVRDEKMLDAIRTSLSGEQSIFEGEYTSVTGGKTTFVKANFVPVFSENKALVSGVGIIEDVTDHVKAHQALRESEEMYRNIIENMSDVYYRADLDGNLIMVSPSGARLLGYDSPKEMIGKNIARKFYANPKDRKDFQREIIKHGKIRFQGALKRKDGKTIVTESISHLIYDIMGKPIAVDGIFRDVTERVKTEEMLRESEERFRQLAEGAFEAIVLHDKGVIIEANNRYYEMFGYQPEELAGKDVIPLTTAPESEEQIRKQISSGNLGPYEIIGVKKDGTRFPMESRIKLIDYKGRKVRMAAIRDLTERKTAEAALRERTQELELKTNSLEEINTAMKVLLKKREEDKFEIEDNVLTNVKELIVPYFDKIKATQLDDQQKTFLSIIESNMNEIVSPFTRRLSLKYLKLTPTEIKIANMIKHGYTTKKIAEVMNISARTVDTHRKNIRTKIGLENKGANLRSYLLTLH